jgi:hypothetical protein
MQKKEKLDETKWQEAKYHVALDELDGWLPGRCWRITDYYHNVFGTVMVTVQLMKQGKAIDSHPIYGAVEDPTKWERVTMIATFLTERNAFLRDHVENNEMCIAWNYCRAVHSSYEKEGYIGVMIRIKDKEEESSMTGGIAKEEEEPSSTKIFKIHDRGSDVYRRFRCKPDMELIQRILNTSKTLIYIDDENDKIVITCNEELVEALNFAVSENGLVRLCLE